MGVTLYKVAEQIKNRLKKGAVQIYISDVVDAYSALVKKEWYENMKSDDREIDGAFVYTFPPMTPELDEVYKKYYISVPSTYLRLPNEMGIIYIGFPDSAFIRVTSGSAGMYDGLKSDIMGGYQTYYSEGMKFYFPKMTQLTQGDVVCKLACAYDNVSPDEELNLSRSVISELIDIVVARYTQTPPSAGDKTA